MSETKKQRGEKTREAILTAAEAEFSDHGFDGTRVDAIAERSGSNKNLLFRYFGDKLGLYAAVLRRADQELHELQAQVFSPLLADQPATALATVIGVIFDYLVDHPRFLRILTWEMAAGWRTTAQIITEGDREEISPPRTNAPTHQVAPVSFCASDPTHDAGTGLSLLPGLPSPLSNAFPGRRYVLSKGARPRTGVPHHFSDSWVNRRRGPG